MLWFCPAAVRGREGTQSVSPRYEYPGFGYGASKKAPSFPGLNLCTYSLREAREEPAASSKKSKTKVGLCVFFFFLGFFWRAPSRFSSEMPRWPKRKPQLPELEIVML